MYFPNDVLDDSVTGITGILLYRVTEVFHKEISEYRIWNDPQTEDLCKNEKCSRLLAIVPGVRSIREWPMSVLKGGFYNQVTTRRRPIIFKRPYRAPFLSFPALSFSFLPCRREYV